MSTENTQMQNSSFDEEAFLANYFKEKYAYEKPTYTQQEPTTETDPTVPQASGFNLKTFVNNREASGTKGVLKEHYPNNPKLSAYGDYGLTNTAFLEVQRNDPYFKEKKLKELNSEDQSRAYDVYKEVQKRELLSKGIEATDENLARSHLLGTGGLKHYLTTGQYLESTLRNNAPSNLDYNKASDREKIIAHVRDMDESNKLGYLLPEYRKAKAAGQQLASRWNKPVDSVAKVQPTKPEMYRVIDGDTVEDASGDHIRFPGINAREIPNFDPTTGRFKGGDYGGLTEKELLEKVMVEQGFNIPVKYKKDVTGNRYEGDFLNAKGEKVTDFLLRNNLTSTSSFTTEQQGLTKAWGRIEAATRAANEPSNRFDLAEGGLYKLEQPYDYIREQLVSARSEIPLDTKPYAATARLYGQNPEWYVGPGQVLPGEDKMGYATSTISTGFSSAANNWKRSMHSVLDMANYALGNTEARKDFTLQKEYYDRVENELPFLRNPEAFDSQTGEWKLDTLNKFGDWFVGTAAQSAPDMPMSIISTMMLAPTRGLSFIPGMMRYAGEIWNDQTEDKKNVWAALIGGAAMNTADTFGAKGLLNSMSIKEIGEKAIAAKMAKGATREAAEKAFIAEQKTIYGKLAQVGRSTLGGVEAGVIEGTTESLQDLTSYFAKQGFDLEVQDPTKLKNQLFNSFAGGFALGGAMSAGGSAYQYATQSFENTAKPNDMKFREEKFLSQNKSVPFATDIISQAVEENYTDETSLDSMAAPEESKRSTSGLVGTVKDWWANKGPSSLFHKGFGAVINRLGNRGEATAALGTILGVANGVNGGSIYTEKENFSGLLLSQLGPFKRILDSFQGLKKDDISFLMYRDDVRAYLKTLSDNAKNFDTKFEKLANGETKRVTAMEQAFDVVNASKYLMPESLKFINAINNFADKINSMALAYSERIPGTRKLSVSDFLENRDLNKHYIVANRKQFINDLMRGIKGLSYNNAVAFVDAVMRNDINSLDEITHPETIDQMLENSSLSGKYISTMIKADKTGLLNKYLHNNLFDNLNSFVHSGGNKYVNEKYLGINGSKVAALLTKALRDNEINLDEASFIAKEFSDFIKIRSGDYHRVDNALVNGGLNLLSFLTTISSLPLAAISSITEFGLVMRNLNTKQTLQAYQSLLSSLSKDLFATVKEIGTTNKYHDLNHRNQLSIFGFETGEASIEQRYDIQSGVYEKLTGAFFKFTGLQSVTNATRYARLSIAESAVKGWYKTLLPALQNKTELTQAQQDAYEHLIRLGYDPVLVAEFSGHVQSDKYNNLSELERDRIERDIMDMWANARHNFVNEAVAHPTPLNRPKFYSDPYYRLFTLFQGYMSAFTANILPKLYGDLSKKGSADQKNAVITIATMVALASFGLLLKDLIKFGESPPDWLKGDEEKLAQRLLGATGLLGTGERLLNFAHPLIEQKSNSSFEKLYNIIEGESPPIAYAGKLGKAVDSVLSDDENKTKKIMKVAPFVGSINQLGDYINEQLKR